MANIKLLAQKEDKLTGGHRLCPGCGAGIIARQALMAAGDTPVVVGSATGCLEVSTTIFPYSSWKVPFIHTAFENAAATMSGVEAAYKALQRTGKVAKDKDIRFITFGGDGGTYDIGLQSLSGAMERRHRLLYICYNNEAYMNTGIQRSGATPKGANTTTAPVGKVKSGKEMTRKDLTAIMVAHDIPYVGQSVVGMWNDFVTKVQKALNTDGPTFINILQPCRLGWAYPPEDTCSLGKLGAETCYWPVYEVENGKYKLNYRPKEKKPITEFLKPQVRFKHLFSPKNAELLALLQREVDERWEKLLTLCGEKV